MVGVQVVLPASVKQVAVPALQTVAIENCQSGTSHRPACRMSSQLALRTHLAMAVAKLGWRSPQPFSVQLIAAWLVQHPYSREAASSHSSVVVVMSLQE